MGLPQNNSLVIAPRGQRGRHRGAVHAFSGRSENKRSYLLSCSSTDYISTDQTLNNVLIFELMLLD